MSTKFKVTIEDAFEAGYFEGQKDFLQELKEIYEISSDMNLILQVLESRIEKKKKNQELIGHLRVVDKGLDK